MLRRIYKYSRGDESVPSIDLVIIPSSGATLPQAWQDTSQPWLQELISATIPRAQVWYYAYRTNTTGVSVLQQLFDEGAALLDCVSGLPKLENTQAPTIFISHSIGGIVLKKALCIARERYYNFRSIIDAISGVVFLGTPHSLGDEKLESNILDLLLRSQQRILPKHAFVKTDNAALIDLSRQFEVVNLQIPVISVYEGRETKIHDSLFARFRKSRQSIIVSQSRSRTNSKHERLIQADANHNDICKLKLGSPAYNALLELAKSVVENAPILMAEQTRTYNIPCGLEFVTLRSQTTVPAPLTETSGGDGEDIAIVSTSKLTQPNSGEATAGSTQGSMEIIPLPASFEPTKKNPVLPCYSLGSYKPNEAFYGRTEVLQLIDKSLLPTQRPPSSEKLLRSFALCGMGGIGKTDVAVQYVFTRKTIFEAIFWLHADDSNILAENFARIAQDLGLEAAEEAKDLTVSREKVQGWLSNPVRSFDSNEVTDDEVPWLLVFDNADNLEVLNDYWPITGHGSILVTSRDPLAKKSFYTVNQGIDVEPFKGEETVEIIKALTHNSATANEEDLVALAERLAGLPLAIIQMAGLIRRLRLSHSDALKLYDQARQEFFNMKTEKQQSGYEHCLATVWAFDSLSKEAFTLLECLSFLDPDQIPERILTEGITSIAVDNWPGSLFGYYRARKELTQSSLITYNGEREQIRVHRMLQEATKAKMDQGRFIEIFRGMVTLLEQAWPFQSLIKRHNTARWKECAALFPSIIRIKDLFQESSHLAGHKPTVSLASLLNDAGWYLFEKGFPQESRTYFQAARSVCERLDNQTTEDVAYQVRLAHGNEGCAAAESNDREGCLYHSKIWLQLSMARVSPSGLPIMDFELGTIYNEAGVAYALNDLYDAAAECFLQSISVYKSVDDFNDTMLGWPEPNLGLVYWIQGDLDNAEFVLNEILEIHASAFGVDDTQSFKTGKILYALGNVRYSQSRLEESMNLHARALVQFRSTLGNGHRRTADVSHRLAGHYMRLGYLDEADRLLEQALTVFRQRKIYKEELSRTTYKTGQLLSLQGKEVEATASFESAFKLYREMIPTNDPDAVPVEVDFDKLVPFWSR